VNGKCVYAILTDHGFGHASRTAQILSVIKQKLPGVRIIVNSSTPSWFFKVFLGDSLEIRSSPMDAGIVQSDALKVDISATKRKLDAIYSDRAKIVSAEADFIRKNRVQLVIGDIPALAVDAAHAAGVNCALIGNFGWDFVYRGVSGLEDFARLFQDSYARCDFLFRLPFHEPMNSFGTKMDTGVTGLPPGDLDLLKNTYFSTDRVKKSRRIFLTFGGLGLHDVPYRNTIQNKFSDTVFFTMDQEAPDLPNLIKIDGHQFRPGDVMRLCDLVLTKPGYGTFCEIYSAGTDCVCLERQHFPETPVLLDSLRKYFRHRIVSEEEFFRSDWTFLTENLSPPSEKEGPGTNGTFEAAEKILEMLDAQN